MLNAASASVLSLAWLLALALSAARLLRWTIGDRRLVDDRATAVVLFAMTALLAVGLTWGLPGPSWAPDELDPSAVRDALSMRFANGWHDKYPPFHFVVLAFASAPVLLAERWSLLAPEVSADNALMVQFRLVSLVMAVGCLVLLGALGRRMRPTGGGWLVILCGALMLPFAYYAKTANLDVPYTFWLLLSFVLLSDIHQHGGKRAWVAFGVTSALAIATKDQAYGLYVLPASHLAWMHRQRLRLVGLSLTAAVVTFLLAHNALANPAGLLAHFGALLGPASANYRMFPMTPAGQVQLAAATAQCLVIGTGWAGLLLLVAGLTNRTTRPPLWVGLAALSCYVTFLVPAGYVYDRFLLPLLLLLAPTTAAGAARLFGGSSRAAGRPLAVGLVALLVWRAASLDVLLLRDSRYAAEAWLASHASAGATIGYPGLTLYLPRLDPYAGVLLTPTIAETADAPAEFIVVNTEWIRRFEPGSPRRLWFDWLEQGTGAYEQVFRYKDPLHGTSFAWTKRFTDRIEDPLTNLDKANPEIAIFELKTRRR